MPKMLRHVKTGEIWPMNPNLARHPDVEVYDEPDPQFAAALATAEASSDQDDGPTIGELAAAGEASSDQDDVSLGDLIPEPPKDPSEVIEVEDVPDFVEGESEAEIAAKEKRAAAAKKAAETRAKNKAKKEAKAAAKSQAEAAQAEADDADDEDLFDDLDLELDDD